MVNNQAMYTQNREKLVQFGGQIPPSLLSEVKIFVAKRRMTQTEFYENAFREYIERHQNDGDTADQSNRGDK